MWRGEGGTGDGGREEREVRGRGGNKGMKGVGESDDRVDMGMLFLLFVFTDEYKLKLCSFLPFSFS